jgi:hypothetical protein
MELLAFTHAASAYEDPSPELKLRSFDELGLQVSSSAWLGVTGIAVAASILGYPPEANAVVAPGDVCAEVSDIQSALFSAGFNPGSIDGVYGPNTTAAVVDFQQFNGLAADGLVGPATAGSLGLSDIENPESPYAIGTGCVDGAPVGGGEPVFVASASGVNIRESAGLTRIIGFAASGEEVVIIPETRIFRDGYSWVRLAETSGWVAEEFLSSGGGDGDGTIGGGYEGPATVVADSGLNARLTPSGAVAYTLADGASVFLTGEYSFLDGLRWGRISGGEWVAVDFLSIGDSTPGGGLGGGGIFFGPTGTRVVSTLSGLGVNVRDTPDGVFLYGLDDGAAVRLTGRYAFEGGFQWAEITGGGWLATDYLI